MALNALVQVEVRTGGDDNNGGGFKEGASGTDYTLQDASQLALTDLATSGAGVTTLTSATGGFTAAMIGNLIQIRSGTNVTAGFYEITAHTDTNTVTLDRAPDDTVGGISGASGDVGGAMASPGMAVGILTTSGMRMWIKTGTYTMTTSTPGAAGPVVTLTDNNNWLIRGYNTTRGDLDLQVAITNKPIISAGAITGITLWTTNASSNPGKSQISFVLDGNDGAGNNGINPGGRSIAIGLHVKNCPGDGFVAVGALTIACEADSCGEGFKIGQNIFLCVAHDCTGDGFNGPSDVYARGCISYNNGGDGFQGGTRSKFTDCISHGNTSAGYRQATSSTYCVNCIATDNGTFGFDTVGQVINCATRNNTSGEFNSVVFEIGNILLTADPYTDSAGNDYTLNDTAGGGALLRALALAFPGQTKIIDIGGYGHSDPAGGGILVHPGMGGGARG